VRIISIGEVLWDVIGDQEYLGGAPLNFAAHARKLGHEVFLVSGVGEDVRGRRALDRIQQLGLTTEFLQVLPGKATGTANVELDTDGKPMFRIVRPAAYDFVALDGPFKARLAALQPHWIYVGTLYHTARQSLAATLHLMDEISTAKRLYDVNLRDGNWNLSTVEQLAAKATVIKLSDSEAEFLDGSLNSDGHQGSVKHFCRRWSDQYTCKTICVTLGERGCAIYKDGTYVEGPGCRVNVADTVGAGDAFAAAFLHGIDQGWDTRRCGTFANAVGALVASRSGPIPDWNVGEVQAMVDKDCEE